MHAVGLTLLALAVVPAAPPAEKVTLSGLRLARGEELVYRGEVVVTCDRVESRFTKKWTLDVRVFVLEAGEAGTDCAVMTVLTPQADFQIQQAVKAATGTALDTKANSTVRLDLFRVDDRGQVKLLFPAVSTPLTLDNKTPTANPPPVPTDGPAVVELGLALPLPLVNASVGDTWDTVEPNRPPVVWSAKQTAVWNGRRVVDVTGLQQTDGYDAPTKVRHGWQRTEGVLVSPADGMVSSLTRTVVRREGTERVGSVTTTVELQPSARHVGVKYRDTRSEVEAGWVFAAGLEQLRAGKPKPSDLDALRREVERYVEQRPTATGFRPAIDAVLRRFESNVAPPVTLRTTDPTKTELPTVGKPAPDFTCADVDRPTNRVRLSGVRGRPAVVAFFKPGSETSEETLTVCEALHRKYCEKATVIPLSLGGELVAASKQRAALKYSVPVFDGEEVRDKYAVRSYPLFYLVDGDGTVQWVFDAGIGPEVGSLVKKELEKVLK